ncbi:MAG: PAS domain S-box protein, partial [Chloroflexi bacterium]|nr:PAS domain S-box protein [Chloroflexota bacterium]
MSSISISQRVMLLRWVVPVAIAIGVGLYQVLVLEPVDRSWGRSAHLALEFLLFGLVGPAIMWTVLSWIGRSLAEREEAIRIMREQERYLASITTASADAIISFDPHDRIRSWNRGAELIFGYSDQEMMGQAFHRIVPPELIAQGELEHLRREADRHGFVRNFETERLTRDGRRVKVDITRTALHNEAGRVAGYVAVIRDITDRKEREAAILEERGRIARDIHDGVTQDLAFLLLKIDMARKFLHRDAAQAEGELRTTKEELRRAIAELRRIILALRPAELERLGFWPALRKLVEDFGQLGQMEAQLIVRGEERDLPGPLETAVFRVTQEALNNVAKHARARRVQVEIDLPSSAHGPDHSGAAPHPVLHLTVRDDGTGFDPEQVARFGE